MPNPTGWSDDHIKSLFKTYGFDSPKIVYYKTDIPTILADRKNMLEKGIIIRNYEGVLQIHAMSSSKRAGLVDICCVEFGTTLAIASRKHQ